MDTLTMNVERRWFAEIVAKTKRIEYRDQSPFWKRRIEPLSTSFKLRLLNGMTPPVPEATVIVTKVTRRDGGYQLHLGRVLEVRRWNRRTGKPARGSAR